MATTSAPWPSSRIESRFDTSSTTARPSSRSRRLDRVLRRRSIPTLYAKGDATRSSSLAIASRSPASTGVSSPPAGEAIKTPLPGAGKPNPYCASFTSPEADRDRERAIGRQHRHASASFRVAHLGDLTWNKEFDLMCPSQSHWHGRSLHRVASRPAGVECRRFPSMPCSLASPS